MSINTNKQLRKLRLACKISQVELGKMFQPAINYATISKIENGERDFPARYAKQIDLVIQSLEEFSFLLKYKKIRVPGMRGRKVKHSEVEK